jgi:hypothetical protein
LVYGRKIFSWPGSDPEYRKKTAAGSEIFDSESLGSNTYVSEIKRNC